MTRYHCDNISSYRDYAIFDLKKSSKPIEDYWNEEEECYETWKFNNYLIDETESILTGEQVITIMNKLQKENEELRILYNEIYNKYDIICKGTIQLIEHYNNKG